MSKENKDRLLNLKKIILDEGSSPDQIEQAIKAMLDLVNSLPLE